MSTEKSFMMYSQNGQTEPQEIAQQLKDARNEVDRMKNSSINPKFSGNGIKNGTRFTNSNYNSIGKAGNNSVFTSSRSSQITQPSRNNNNNNNNSHLSQSGMMHELIENLQEINKRMRNVSQDIQIMNENFKKNKEEKVEQEEQPKEHKNIYQSSYHYVLNEDPPKMQNISVNLEPVPNFSQKSNIGSQCALNESQYEPASSNFQQPYESQSAFQTPRQNEPQYGGSSQGGRSNTSRIFIKNSDIEYEQYEDRSQPANNYKAFRQPNQQEWQEVDETPMEVKEFIKIATGLSNEGSSAQKNQRLEGANSNFTNASTQQCSRGKPSGFESQFNSETKSYKDPDTGKFRSTCSSKYVSKY